MGRLCRDKEWVMKRVICILSIALSVTALSCGVNLDFSSLSFEPGAATDEDTGTVGPADVEGQETGSADSVAPDTSPDSVVPPEMSCWELFDCVIFEKVDLALTETTFNQCKGSEEWLSESAVLNLRGCLDDCLDGTNGDDLGKCLGSECLDETLTCVNDTEGDKTCGQAMICTVDECAQYSDGDKQQIDCMLGCFDDMDHLELPRLKQVMDQCMAGGEEDSFECQESVYQCYAGTGEKSCYDVLQCMAVCNKDCEGGECDDGTCFNHCIYGIHEDAAGILLEMARCNVYEEHNVFSCLIAAATCLHDHMGGFTTCQATVKALSNDYYSTALSPIEKYHKMSQTVTGIKPAKFDAIMQVLECLMEKWEAHPGYGQIPEMQWNACALKCG